MLLSGLVLTIETAICAWIIALAFGLVIGVFRTLPSRAAGWLGFAYVEFFRNMPLLVQLFLTGRIVRLLGVGPTLAFLPALTIVGFGVLALLPSIASLVTFQVLRRSSDYAIARPTREVLYTVVPREDRYKAKSFIDTVVYRAGDQVGAWSFTWLSGIGLGPNQIGLAAVIVSAIWLANALWLGREQDAMAAAETQLAEAE